MQITVNHPRPIVIGPCVLLPGPNPMTSKLERAIKERPAAQRLLRSLEKSKDITVDKEASDEPLSRAGLQGLPAEQAAKLIESSESAEELEEWAKTAGGKIKSLIKGRLDELRAGG